MTDYAPQNSQDQNHIYTNQRLAMSHYSHGNNFSYLCGNGQVQYQPIQTSYPAYTAPYVPSHHTESSSTYLPSVPSVTVQYQLPTNGAGTLPSQPQSLPRTTYFTPTAPTHRSSFHQHRNPLMPNSNPLAETESQESVNEATMLSEPVVPPLEGYPDVKDFDDLMNR